MSILISENEEIDVYSAFVNEDPSGGEYPVFPDTVEGTIERYDPDTKNWVVTDNFDPEDDGNGVWKHVFSSPIPGKFRITFTAQFGITTVTNKRVLFIGPLSTTHTLAGTKTYDFFGGLDPLFVSPEEIQAYYPDGKIGEIASYVHMFSKELLTIMKVPHLEEITPVQREWIIASVLCMLSRIYVFGGGMHGFSSADEFRLGDLSVSRSATNRVNQASANSGRAGASTWCELAAVLREELVAGKAGMKAIVKGTNFANPIPERQLRRFE